MADKVAYVLIGDGVYHVKIFSNGSLEESRAFGSTGEYNNWIIEAKEAYGGFTVQNLDPTKEKFTEIFGD